MLVSVGGVCSQATCLRYGRQECLRYAFDDFRRARFYKYKNNRGREGGRGRL